MMKKKIFLLIFACTLVISQNAPYTILVSLDGFRYDYLDRNITPNMQKIIDDGVRAISLRPSYPSKTFPNHLTIITGMHPQNHGIIANRFKNPFSNEFYEMKDTAQIRNPKWYLGEAFGETAERHNIITASYYWPGSELSDPERRPTYFHYYNHNFKEFYLEMTKKI
ncbi:MAG: ectonucleotide pyrophosphatase/phosphodiesterase [Ignavibacteria bacterium]|jgi:predicted AlkP superfamily pyrophosphatase or phosphodiesterase